LQTLQTLQLRKNIFKNILENLELLELLKSLETLENLKKIIHTHSVYFLVKITRVANKKSVLSVG